MKSLRLLSSFFGLAILANCAFGQTAPSITGLSANIGIVGDTITISGTNFGATQGSSRVTFNGTDGTPANWSAGSIVVPVPSGATTGNIVVMVNSQSSIETFVFTVKAHIDSVSMSQAPPLGGFVITGTTFGNNPVVKLGNTQLTVIGSSTATSITVQIPAGTATGSGNIVVTASGNDSNSMSFSVVAPFGCS